MIVAHHHVGRLIEVVIASPTSSEEIAALAQTMKQAITRVGKCVIVTLLHRAAVFPTELTDQFIALMKSDNPAIERSAFLVSESALLGMQIERLIQAAENPRRKAFRKSADLYLWVGEVLSADEKRRLQEFFVENEV